MRTGLVLLCLILLPSAPALGDDVLTGWTRMGSVYQRQSLTEGSAAMCQALCDRDGQCQAWVWTYGGLAGVDNQCALLAATPEARRSPGHVTGLSVRLTTRIEAGGDRAPSEREIRALRATLPGPE